MEIKNPYKEEVHQILKELDVGLSDTLSELDEQLLSEDGKQKRREISLVKKDHLSDFSMDDDILEEIKLQ